MANFKITEGTKQELNNIPFVDGQVLMEINEQNSDCYMYLDTLDENDELKRVLMGSKTELRQYTITYNGNGATGGSTENQRKVTDYDIELRSCGFVKTGYIFKEWNTQSDGNGRSMYPNETYYDNASITLYAIWRNPTTYTITYNGNGATSGEVDPQTKYKDEPIYLRENEFYRPNFRFKEWNTQSDGQGTSYSEEDIYTENASVTLYAIWESTEPQPDEYIIVAFHNNDNYDISSPYYFEETLATGSGMNVGSEITYGKVNAIPSYGAITTNYYVSGGTSTLCTFGFYVSKDSDGVENTDNIHSSDVTSVGSFTITNNITGETETWYVSANTYTIQGDYSSVSVPYFDSTNLVNEVDGAEGLKALGRAFLLAIGQNNTGDFDIIGLSDVPFQSVIGDNVQETVVYAGNTYYYYNKLNCDYDDYALYDFALYTNNTYTLRDKRGRGELAYIIFDGDINGNKAFTHATDQYITGIYTQPVWATQDEVTFKNYSRDDWQTTARDFDNVTLSATNNTSPVYIVFLQYVDPQSLVALNGFYMYSENSFTAHVHKERFFAGSLTPWQVQNWDETVRAVTKNDITYYASDVYYGSNVVLNKYIDVCSLKYTITSTTSFGNDERWELAYIIFDGVASEKVDYVTHTIDQYITGIWNQPIPINHYEVNNNSNPLLSTQSTSLFNNFSITPRSLSTPILTTNNILIAEEIKVQSNDGEIQIYNPLREEWFNLFSCVSKEQVIELNDNDTPTFTFDVLDIKYPQKMEIYSSINELSPNKITYTTIAEDIPSTMTIEFEPFISSEIPSHATDKVMSCKVYFYSPKQNLIDVDEWEVVPFDLPYDCYGAAACVHNGRLHILGGVNNPTKHFSWDGIINSWREESTLPYECNDCAAISYKGAIHIMGGVNNYKNHYSWTSGNTWVQQTDLPINFCGKDKVVIYQDKLRLVSSGYGYYGQFRYICTWTDPTLTEAGSWTTLDIGTNNTWNQSEVFNDMIYMLSASGDGRSCRTYDGTTFNTGVSLPTSYGGQVATSVSFGGKIHLIGVSFSNAFNRHLKFDGTNWTIMNTTPCNMNGSTAVVFKNRIYVLGNSTESEKLKLYRWKGLEV